MGLWRRTSRTDGLLLPMSIRLNMSLANLRNLLSRLRPFIARASEERITREYVTKLNIKSTSIEQKVGTLSGGNQQKVVVGRWLQTKPLIFLLDEPTRGLDVEAKAELHSIVGDLADSGAAVLIVSSDLDEIISLSDRFLVMVRGRIVEEFPRRRHQASPSCHCVRHFRCVCEGVTRCWPGNALQSEPFSFLTVFP